MTRSTRWSLMPRREMSRSIMVRRASLKIVSGSPAAESRALSIKNDDATVSKQKQYRLTEDKTLSFCIIIEPTSLIQAHDGSKIEIPYRCSIDLPKDLPLSSLRSPTRHVLEVQPGGAWLQASCSKQTIHFRCCFVSVKHECGNSPAT
jgi:hypothetical protein